MTYYMDADAIFRAYPNVCQVSGNDAYDVDGNLVEIDRDLVDEMVPIVRREKGFKQLRYERNQKLSETDWWTFSDSPEATPDQLAYRQALRDLPANTTDPANPVWPTKPE